MMGIETRVDVLETDETFHEQAGAGEENEGQRDFGDNQRTAQAVATLPRRRTAPTFF